MGSVGDLLWNDIYRYNLLSIGDVIKSKTVRKVKSTSATDVVTVTKKVLTLSLKVCIFKRF